LRSHSVSIVGFSTAKIRLRDAIAIEARIGNAIAELRVKRRGSDECDAETEKCES
jgi:hypothetical protein